jgi:release factor glutamine methyltransferase
MAGNRLRNSSDAPDLDAQRLLLHVLKQTESSWLLTHSERVLSSQQETAFQGLIERRAGGEPLAYLLGWQEFYGRRFEVTPDVLIPRPSTEALVEQSVDVIKKMASELGRPLTIADIGTGSGCIAITLALEAAEAIKDLYATDISSAALATARQNAIKHAVSDRIEFRQGNLLEPLKNVQIDLIVSNPPYIPSNELQQPPAPTTAGLRFEPSIALDGGPDGTHFLKKLRYSGIPAVLEGVNGQIERCV